MGLKCSLLGHDYGDVEVERTREEQGNEVVETVREVKQCERCGAESVVSENTEVRTAVDAAEVGLDADAGEPADAGATGSATGDESDLVSAVTHVGDDGAESAESAAETATADDGSFGDVTPGDAAEHPRVDEDDEFEPPTDAAEDDAVILDDEPEEGDDEPDRQPGQWPSADDTRQDERDADASQPDATEGDVESTGDAADAADAVDESDAADAGNAEDGAEVTAGSWPDHDGEDEGFDAAGSQEAETEAGAGAGAGEEEATEERFDAEFIDADENAEGAAPADIPADRLACPECGFDADDSPSLRQGDICPECHRGYLQGGAE